MVSGFVNRIAHISELSEGRREGEFKKRPAIVFTDSDSLANTVKKDVGHPHLILQQSCISTCGQENLCKQNSHRKCLMLPRNKF